jgi:hypothetical protein
MALGDYALRDCWAAACHRAWTTAAVEVVQLVHCARVVATLVVVALAAHWAETVPVAASATKTSSSRDTITFFILVLLFY